MMHYHSVYKNVVFCFQFCYGAFKSLQYFIDRKVAEAVSRFLSAATLSFLPLFFPTPFCKEAHQDLSVLVCFLFCQRMGLKSVYFCVKNLLKATPKAV